MNLDFTPLIAKRRTRFDELDKEITDPSLFDDAKKAREVLKEHSRVKELLLTWDDLENSRRQLVENEELAKENATLLGIDRIAFHEADLLPPPEAVSFDLITANLPYIPAAEIAGLSREVLHDPILALDGGPGGLDLIVRLAPLALERLTPGGHLLLEIGIDQSEAVMACLAGHNYRDIKPLPDYQGIPRFIEAVKG